MIEFVVFTCEHAGNQFPPEFEALFEPYRELLESHRGYDPGAIEFADYCARRVDVPIYCTFVTRLLIETNRSLHHRGLFSEVTRSLEDETKQKLIEEYYFRYRNPVQEEIAAAIKSGKRVLHVSFHSFTPVLDGKTRRADIGLLYDPKSGSEERFSKTLRRQIKKKRPDLVVRMDYPYRGSSDGFVTALRKRYFPIDYLGLEWEINQRWPLGEQGDWQQLQADLCTALERAIEEFRKKWRPRNPFRVPKPPSED